MGGTDRRHPSGRPDVAADWARHSAAGIARCHLPGLDALHDKVRDNRSTPVPDSPQSLPTPDTVTDRLKWLTAKRDRDLALAQYDPGSTCWLIQKEWPSPLAIAALRGIVQHSRQPTVLTAHVVGLERPLGCSPSGATMRDLLDRMSAPDSPLDAAWAIVALLRFTPRTDPPVRYNCPVRQRLIRFARHG